MFDSSNGLAFDLGPVDFAVELLVHKTDSADIIAADKIETQRDLDGGFFAVGSLDHALVRIAQGLEVCVVSQARYQQEG